MNEARIDLCQFVALAATNAVKMDGLDPCKGSIAIGADADLTIWDPDREVTIANDLLHHNVGSTPYEGVHVRGWPATTISAVRSSGRTARSPRPPGAASSAAPGDALIPEPCFGGLEGGG